MKHIKRYEFFESLENKERILITLTTANSAVSKSWSFSSPRYSDFTEIGDKIKILL